MKDLLREIAKKQNRMKNLWNRKEKKNVHYVCQQVTEVLGKIQSHADLPMIYISVIETLEVFACFVKNRLRKLSKNKSKALQSDADFETMN